MMLKHHRLLWERDPDAYQGSGLLLREDSGALLVLNELGEDCLNPIGARGVALFKTGHARELFRRGRIMSASSSGIWCRVVSGMLDPKAGLLTRVVRGTSAAAGAAFLVGHGWQRCALRAHADAP